MAVPQGKNGTYLSEPIKYLYPRHRRMAQLVAVGLKPGEVAKVSGLTREMVTKVLASPMFQAEVDRLLEKSEKIALDLREDLRLMAETAIENIDEDLNLPPATLEERKVRQKASLEVLDRFGLVKQEKPQTQVNVTQVNVGKMTTEELQRDIFDLTAEVVEDE